METKICYKCKVEKSVNEFRLQKSKDKYRYCSWCKMCEKAYSKEHRKKYYEEHKEKEKLYNIEYRKRNEEQIKKSKKLYYEKNRENIIERVNKWKIDNFDKRLKYQQEYQKGYKYKNYQQSYRNEHKKEAKEYNMRYRLEKKAEISKQRKQHYETIGKFRYKNDSLYRFKDKLRTNIRSAFVRKGMRKSKHTEEIVGIPLNKLYLYLLDTFEKNYGYEWDEKEEVHIDHKTPLSTANTEEEVIKLCHYTNLQLLKGKDNLEKSNNLDWTLTKQD